MQAEAGEDARAVFFDGARAEAEPLGDLFRDESTRDEAHDLLFAGCQGAGAEAGQGGFVGEGGGNGRRDGRGKKHAAVEHALDGAVDLLEWRIFIDETRDAEGDEFGGELRFRVRGEHDDAGGDPAFAQGAHEIAAIHVAQVQVGDEEIGRRGEAGFEGIAAVAEIEQFLGLKTPLERVF